MSKITEVRAWFQRQTPRTRLFIGGGVAIAAIFLASAAFAAKEDVTPEGSEWKLTYLTGEDEVCSPASDFDNSWGTFAEAGGVYVEGDRGGVVTDPARGYAVESRFFLDAPTRAEATVGFVAIYDIETDEVCVVLIAEKLAGEVN